MAHSTTRPRSNPIPHPPKPRHPNRHNARRNENEVTDKIEYVRLRVHGTDHASTPDHRYFVNLSSGDRTHTSTHRTTRLKRTTPTRSLLFYRLSNIIRSHFSVFTLPLSPSSSRPRAFVLLPSLCRFRIRSALDRFDLLDPSRVTAALERRRQPRFGDLLDQPLPAQVRREAQHIRVVVRSAHLGAEFIVHHRRAARSRSIAAGDEPRAKRPKTVSVGATTSCSAARARVARVRASEGAGWLERLSTEGEYRRGRGAVQSEERRDWWDVDCLGNVPRGTMHTEGKGSMRDKG